LVAGGQLAANVDGQPAEWIEPPARDRVPNPPFGYVVSFIRFHERGFAVPASRFMRALCYHYGVELHNFTPNAISQAATFVGVCEGFLGISVNWDLWVHLFRAELHTLATSEPRIRHVARASGLSIALRSARREQYIPCTMTTNNAEWERGWFYLRNSGASLPLHRQGAEGEGRLLAPRGVPALAPGAAGLASGRVEGPGRSRADRGVRPRQPPPPADRPPDGEATPHLRDGRGCGPIALAESRLLRDLFPREYAATWARRAIDLRAGRSDDTALWAFAMLPVGQLVSEFFFVSSAGFWDVGVF
jgi:hypothetical protein